MNQPYQQLDPKAIEALKAARNQVIQAENPTPRKVHVPSQPPQAAGLSNGVKDKQEVTFAEEFVRKLSVIEQETAAIDEEMAKVEKLWSGLVEKKKQLEDRRSGLIKVKDKITTLNKEMDDVLSKEL